MPFYIGRGVALRFVDVRSMEGWFCLREGWENGFLIMGCLEMDLCYFLHQGFMSPPFYRGLGTRGVIVLACTLYGGTRGVCRCTSPLWRTGHGLCWGFEVTGYGRLLYMGSLSYIYYSVRRC